MKTWQFIVLAIIGAATLYISYRIAAGLQAAQAGVASATAPVTSILKSLGVTS